jgi:hypothetical protein
MPRRTVSRITLSAALTLAACALVSPMSGCQSGGLAGLMGSKSAMDMLTPMVKDAANSYIASLTSLTSELKNLKDLQGVMDFAKKAQPTVEQLSSSYQTLSGTTGEERSNLMSAFGSQFKSANSGFLNQSSAVKSNTLWGQIASPVLDKVKLFQ